MVLVLSASRIKLPVHMAIPHGPDIDEPMVRDTPAHVLVSQSISDAIHYTRETWNSMV